MANYIHMLKLQGHEEGGYYALFYKSADKVLVSSEEKEAIERSAGSSIYFLLEKKGYSALHRLKYDEIWHYYDGGSPIDIHIIDTEGKYSIHTLGNPALTENARFQVAVKANSWFAAEVRDQTSFGLVACTVTPGFEYSDFELAKDQEEQIRSQFPEHTQIINKFIHPKLASADKAPEHPFISIRNHKLSAADYIKLLNLERHIEGGYFGLSYRSETQVQTREPRYGQEVQTRCAGSSIYFLLDKQDFSAWHRLKSDEVWHYYDGGSPIDIHIIDAQGNLSIHTLGNPNVTPGASFQVAIPAGSWFAAEARDKSSFGLVGCTVSPGFEYQDFELAHRETLAKDYPQHQTIINRLTRTNSPASKPWTNSVLKYATIALVSGAGLYNLCNTEIINTCVNNIKTRLGM